MRAPGRSPWSRPADVGTYTPVSARRWKQSALRQFLASNAARADRPWAQLPAASRTGEAGAAARRWPGRGWRLAWFILPETTEGLMRRPDLFQEGGHESLAALDRRRSAAAGDQRRSADKTV